MDTCSESAKALNEDKWNGNEMSRNQKNPAFSQKKKAGFRNPLSYRERRRVPNASILASNINTAEVGSGTAAEPPKPEPLPEVAPK
jgi:hypothetical protein